MRSGPIIRMEDVWFKYDFDWILKGISLEIYQRELIGIVGPTGSGKTTLVKHFNGLLKPTRGRVLVNGYDTTKYPVSFISKFVGYVCQNPSHQIFAPTVYDEIAFGPNNFGMENVDEIVKKTADTFGLTEKLNASPFSLSMGEKELVCIASILSFDPKVIILDEPTIGQDFESYLRLIGLLKKLREIRKTIVLISHNIDMIAECSDRIIALLNGQKIFDGSSKRFFSDQKLLEKLKLPTPSSFKLKSIPQFKETLLDSNNLLKWLRE